MKKLLLISAIAALSASNIANADEIRVVVKKKASTYASSTFQKMAPAAKFSTVTVNSANEVDALKASGQYESVEIDYMVYTPDQAPNTKVSSARKNPPPAITSAASIPSSNKAVPNDPGLMFQTYWTPVTTDIGNGLTETHPGRSNILEAHQKVKPKVKPRVAVIDSSFGADADVPYAQGYSFTTAYGRQRQADFITPDNILEVTGAAHGLSVASIIGSTTNNGVGMAGIADVDLVAVQSMYGGGGYLSDTADAITWVAGGHINGVPDIAKPVDVINMSLSSKIPSGCPSYIQEPINFAVSKGIVVVVAAGNNGEDVNLYSPANCQNVVVVGAIQDNGKKSDYSNVGNKVDLMALGQGVYAMSVNHTYAWWDGTSQATPIVAGVVAMAKSEFPGLVQEEAESLLKVTAESQSDASCANNACGAGVMNASEFLDMTRDYMNSKENYIKHVLNDGDSCGSAVFKDYFGQALRLCQMYEITFDVNADVKSNVTYQLYAVPSGKAFYLANANKVLETKEPSVVTGNTAVDATSQYGYLACTNGVCGTQLIRMSTEKIAKPSICN